MGITTKLLDDSPQANGTRHIGVLFTTSGGKEIVRYFWADEKFDTKKDIEAMIPGMETYIAGEEAQRAVAAIEKGEVVPDLEFATDEQVKTLAVEKEAEKEAEITRLTTEKTFLSEVE